MAGEAKEAGAASVTLMHSGAHLGPSEKQGATMLRRLQRQGVAVELGTRAEAADDSGKRFRVGAGVKTFSEVFWCVGNKPVSAFGRGLGDVVSPSGHFIVNSHFQVRTITTDKPGSFHNSSVSATLSPFTKCSLRHALPVSCVRSADSLTASQCCVEPLSSVPASQLVTLYLPRCP